MDVDTQNTPSEAKGGRRDEELMVVEDERVYMFG